MAVTAALWLAGCAAPHVARVTVTPSPLSGAYMAGTIVAVRDTSAAVGSAGLAGVLGALHAPQVNAAGAQELVIRRADRSVTSLVQSPQAGEPPFRAGENVAIITASDTVVRAE
jgi:outer membrane lipoprotein SlyB